MHDCNGPPKAWKNETNNEDSKKVISEIAREAGLDEGEFMKHVFSDMHL